VTEMRGRIAMVILFLSTEQLQTHHHLFPTMRNVISALWPWRSPASRHHQGRRILRGQSLRLSARRITVSGQLGFASGRCDLQG
jgi:hypothetical protein